MQHNQPSPPEPSVESDTSQRGRIVFLGIISTSFVLFVLGGLLSGMLFLSNVAVVVNRRPMAPQPGAVAISPTGPQSSGPLNALSTMMETLKAPASSGGATDREQPRANPAVDLARLLPSWTGRERLNVLLLGIDQRGDERAEETRSDTVMLVSVDPTSKSVVMVSFPRDLWVTIPGFGEQRLNVAHFLGGPELVKRTVAANFGVTPTHYARINFRGFEEIVDALGGVVVDAERPIKDDEYPTEDYGVMRIFIPAGPQWMNGPTALQYARSRHSENDFGRARRQQRVLMAVRDRGMHPSVIPKATELIPLAQKTLTTDFGPGELLALGGLSRDIQRQRIANLVVDVSYATPYTTSDGADVLIPNRAAIRSAIVQAFERAATAAVPTAPAEAAAPAQPAEETPPEPVAAPPAPRVEVLNGTDRAGLARATADWLQQRGYEIAEVDSANRSDYAESVLQVQPGHEQAAQVLATTLGLPPSAIHLDALNDGVPEIRLVLGRNYQLPAR